MFWRSDVVEKPRASQMMSKDLIPLQAVIDMFSMNSIVVTIIGVLGARESEGIDKFFFFFPWLESAKVNS